MRPFDTWLRDYILANFEVRRPFRLVDSRSVAGDVQYNHEARPHRYSWDTLGLILGHEPDLDHPQYLHFPSWIAYLVDPRKTQVQQIAEQLSLYQKAQNREGICSVTSHKGHDDVRGRFIRSCSGIENGGSYFNNTGGPVPSKTNFLRNYKYHVCIENDTRKIGYVTEKLPHAIQAGCVPIYAISNFSAFEEIVFNRAAIIDPAEFDWQENETPYFRKGAASVVAVRIAELKDKLCQILS